MTEDRIELGLSRDDRAFLLVGLPLAGMVVGFALPYLWRLVDDVGLVPFRAVLEWLTSLEHGWQSVLRVGLLGGGGLVLALAAIAADVRVSVGDRDITVVKGGARRTIAREQVAGVRREGKRLVIETVAGRRLLDEPVEGARTKAAPAFRRFGYPWENDDD